MYLSIKDDCKTYKAEAKECCSNPNQCAGLMKDIALGVAPALPSLYSAYKGYQTSKKVSSETISLEEAQQKMCDVRNKVAMGSYLNGLLSQLGKAFETTCRDKINACKSKCNSDIDIFKAKFINHFSPKTGKHTIEENIELAKKCAQIEDTKNFDIDLKDGTLDILKVGECTHCKVVKKLKNMKKLIDTDKVITCPDSKQHQQIQQMKEDVASISATIASKIDIESATIKHILIFAKAYARSSDIKGKKLRFSEKSDEREIVNCAQQKDRQATSSNPGERVRSPAVTLCHRVAEQVINNPIPPRMPSPSPSGPTPAASLTGGQLDTGKGSPFFMDPNTEYGVVPDEDLPDPNNKPGLSPNPPTWAGSGSSGSSGGGGNGGVSGGGLGGGSGSSGGDSGMPYSSWGSGIGIPDTFMGGGDYSQGFAGGSGEGGGPYSNRQAAASSLDDLDDMKGLSDDEMGDPDFMNGKSIFNLVSKRIQQFCADHSCIE